MTIQKRNQQEMDEILAHKAKTIDKMSDSELEGVIQEKA